MYLTRRDLLKSAGAVSLITLTNPRIIFPQTTPVLESRAILDEGLNWFQQKATPTLCERIKEAGFNVFIPCIWHGRGTTWPSSLAPWDDRLADPPNYDPLENLLNTAESFELEVHPWFTLGLRQRDFFREFATSPSASATAFDFHNPSFRTFIVNLMLEVVKRYPIQGVNLDFVRFNSPKPGFEAEQEAVVGDVVRRTYRAAKALKPNLVVSADVAPWSPTIKQFGQDGPKWADEGIMDVVYSMQYHWAPDFEIIQHIKSQMARPETMVVMIGNFDRIGPDKKVVPRDPQRVVQLIEQSRAISSDNGVCLYLYGQLSNEQILALKSTVFKTPAVPHWKLLNTKPLTPTG